MTGTSADCRRGVMKGKREKGERHFDFSIFRSHIYLTNFIKSFTGPLILKTFQRFLVKLGLFFKVCRNCILSSVRRISKN